MLNNITELFHTSAEKYPSNIAIIEGNVSTSYAQLQNSVFRTAGYFKSKGISKGDRVMVFIPMSKRLYTTVLALMQIGAVVVFVDEWADKKRLQACCEESHCKYLVAPAWIRLFAKTIKPLKQIPNWLSPKEGSELKEIITCNYDDSALVTFTTGSTGKPKGANRTHGFLHEQFKVVKKEIQLNEKDVQACNLPIILFCNLAVGATSLISKFNVKKPHKFNSIQFAESARKHKVNKLVCSPYFLKNLSEFKIDFKPESVFTGGGPVFPSEAKSIVKAFPNSQLTVVYGSTEAEPVSSVDMRLLAESNFDKGILVGKVSEEIELKIASNGEIQVKGDHVLKSYINQPPKPEWHAMGDSGVLIADNLYLLGRTKDLIEYNGKKLSPFVVQAQLLNEGVSGTLVSLNNEPLIVVEGENTPTEKLLGEIGVQSIKKVDKIPRDPRHVTKVDMQGLITLLGTSF